MLVTLKSLEYRIFQLLAYLKISKKLFSLFAIEAVHYIVWGVQPFTSLNTRSKMKPGTIRKPDLIVPIESC